MKCVECGQQAGYDKRVQKYVCEHCGTAMTGSGEVVDVDLEELDEEPEDEGFSYFKLKSYSAAAAATLVLFNLPRIFSPPDAPTTTVELTGEVFGLILFFYVLVVVQRAAYHNIFDGTAAD